LRGLTGIRDEGLRLLLVGSGKVGGGASEVCEWLGLTRLAADAVLAERTPVGSWYAVLHTADIVRARSGSPFDHEEYRKFGKERYESTFSRYLGHFDVLLQTPYWDDKYPKQLTHAQLA